MIPESPHVNGVRSGFFQYLRNAPGLFNGGPVFDSKLNPVYKRYDWEVLSEPFLNFTDDFNQKPGSILQAPASVTIRTPVPGTGQKTVDQMRTDD